MAPRVICCLFLVISASSALAAEFAGAVTDVLNGDTIEVMNGSGPMRVRLFGVECPDLNQPFGTTARYFTSTSVLNGGTHEPGDHHRGLSSLRRAGGVQNQPSDASIPSSSIKRCPQVRLH